MTDPHPSSRRCGAERTRDVDIDALDWEHSYDRTPYENLRALVHELPDDTPDYVIVDFSFRYIMGLGPSTTPRVLATIRSREEETG